MRVRRLSSKSASPCGRVTSLATQAFMPDFIFRDVRPEDKEQVLAFTANTWEDGDYIHYVYDEWIADPAGNFLAAIDSHSGAVVGIDKLSFLSPTEGWFEGIRVHPDYRGRGLAAQMQTYMIEEARRLGAARIRFVTNVENHAMQKSAYRDGFAARFVARYCRWRPPESESKRSAGVAEVPMLRAVDPDEGVVLFDWWRRSPAYYATGGLMHRDWSFSETGRDEWRERAERGELLVAEEGPLASRALPPAFVIFSRRSRDSATLTISAISALGAQWTPLASALVSYARSAGATEMGGLVPDSGSAVAAMQAAGFDTGGNGDLFALFDLDLRKSY